MNIVPYPQFDFSGGVQDATTWILKKSNELKRGTNLRFTEELGGFERRLGFQQVGSLFSSVPNAPQGGHAANFSTGTVRMVAVNNTAGTATIIRTQDSASGAWSDVSGISYPVNSVIFFFDYLDEVYVSGFDPATGDPVTPYNIDKTLNASATRNLVNAPTGYFFADFNGVLYLANLKYGGVRYPGRVQKASPPLGFMTSIQGAQTGTLTSLQVDSVRYVKAGNSIGIYKAGTETLLYTITVTAVDKAANTISFTSTSITVSDNDEVWLSGTKGKLNVFWNTDYPNPQATGEFLDIKPGKDSSNVISGIRQSSNRLFIWTKNSGTRYDGNNLIVFNNSVGCISQRSIQNIDDDWLIWMDAKGNIRARNEGSGQQEQISRPMRKIIRTFTQTQLKAANAGVVDQTYKIYLGTNADGENIRLCYDFESNTWSPEKLAYPALIQFNDAYTGDLKPYFLSSNGKIYMDETGNLDDDKSIPFVAGTGKDMFNSHELKTFYGILLFTENCNGLKFEAAVENGPMKLTATIDNEECWIPFPQNGDSHLPDGISLDWQITGSVEGDPPRVQGAVPFFTPRERVPSERRP